MYVPVFTVFTRLYLFHIFELVFKIYLLCTTIYGTVIIIENYRNIKNILVILWFGECADYGKYSGLGI